MTTFDLPLRDWERGDWGGVALEATVLAIGVGLVAWTAIGIYTGSRSRKRLR